MDNFPFRQEYLDSPLAQITEHDNCIIVATDGCDGPEHMLNKYKMVGLNHQKWAEYIWLNRNHQKEQNLFFEVLGLKQGEKYAVTTPVIGTPPQHLSFLNYEVSTNLRKVPIFFYDQFTVFDWCKVLEEAEEFFVEPTSPIFLLELLNPKAKRFELFSRDNVKEKHKSAKGVFENVLWNYRQDQIQVRPNPLSEEEYRQIIKK